MFIILGCIELKEETVESLLSTANLLQLCEVVEACCNFLMKQLHPSNCIGIQQFAEAQGCTKLYQVANSYVTVSWRLGPGIAIMFSEFVGNLLKIKFARKLCTSYCNTLR